MGVKGYPVVKYSSMGSHLEYTGSRTAVDIKRFALELSMKQPFTVVNADQLKKLRKDKDVLFLYAYTKRDESILVHSQLTK